MFDVVGGRITLIARLSTTRDDLLRAAQIFQEAVAAGEVNPDELERRLRREAPSATALLDWVSSTNTQAWLQVLNFLALMIFGVEAWSDDSAAVVQQTTITNVTIERAPRNAPCPCGSGKKFKRCHGAHESLQRPPIGGSSSAP